MGGGQVKGAMSPMLSRRDASTWVAASNAHDAMHRSAVLHLELDVCKQLLLGDRLEGGGRRTLLLPCSRLLRQAHGLDSRTCRHMAAPPWVRRMLP